MIRTCRNCGQKNRIRAANFTDRGINSYLWNGPRNYLSLDPASVPAHVFRVRPNLRREQDFDYFM